MLASVFPELRFASSSEEEFCAKPAPIASRSCEYDFEPPVAVPVISVEKIRPERTASSIANKQIEKSVIIIIYQGGISSPTSFLGFYFGEGGGIAKSAIAIVLEKLVGFARALAIYNIQIQISVIVIVPPRLRRERRRG
jgi:hypothetical protein